MVKLYHTTVQNNLTRSSLNIYQPHAFFSFLSLGCLDTRYTWALNDMFNMEEDKEV